MKISELIMSIKNQSIVIPAFQREYVWDTKKAKELIRSLLKEYPIGSVLIWKTIEPIELKNIVRKKDEHAREYQVLLDGQQRATTLYMLFEGEIPPYYTKNEIELKDPRNLAINLLTGELDYWKQRSMTRDSSWQLIVDCMADDETVKPHLIANERYQFFNQLKELESHDFDFQPYKGNRVFGQLRGLLEQVQISLRYSKNKPYKLTLGTLSIEVTEEKLQSVYDGKDTVNESLFRKFLSETLLPSIQDTIPEFKDQGDLTNLLYANLQRLKNLKNYDLPEQTIPPHASFTDAVDIFDKINSQGVALSKADLAMTHVKAKWPDAGDRIKAFLSETAKRGFKFNLSFAARTLGAVATGKSTWESIRSIERKDLEDSWKKTENVIEYLVTVLTDHGIPGSEAMTSNTVLIPLIRFLAKHGGTFQNEIDLRQSIFWLHHALIWRWYSAQADTKLEDDLGTIEKNHSPWLHLIDKIKSQNGRLNLQIETSDLEGAGSNSAFFNLFYIMLRQRQARDWFNGISLSAISESRFTIDRHHIFPRAFLIKNGYSQENEHHDRLINEIANLAFITDTTNKQISDKEPSVYFPAVNKAYPDALESQLITQDESLWKVDKFESFLEERRKLIARELNVFLDSYRQKEDKPLDKETELEGLVTANESNTLEFKETWCYDTVQSHYQGKPIKNTDLNFVIIKTIAGFMNTDGGTLLVGVTDDNAVEGLDRDIELMGGDFDKFQRNITEVIDNAFDAGKRRYYDISFPTYDNHVLCQVQIKPCRSTKTWASYKNETRFFVRRGNATHELNGEESDDYWQERH